MLHRGTCLQWAFLVGLCGVRDFLVPMLLSDTHLRGGARSKGPRRGIRALISAGREHRTEEGKGWVKGLCKVGTQAMGRTATRVYHKKPGLAGFCPIHVKTYKNIQKQKTTKNMEANVKTSAQCISCALLITL